MTIHPHFIPPALGSPHHDSQIQPWLSDVGALNVMASFEVPSEGKSVIRWTACFKGSTFQLEELIPHLRASCGSHHTAR